MSEEKPPSATTSTSRIPRAATLKPALTPVHSTVTPAPKIEPEDARTSAASIPPPPPSQRPLSERPVTFGTSPLPPPAVTLSTSPLPPPASRPPLPTAPPLPTVPSVARVGKLDPSEAARARLEDENQDLRKKLASQRDETKLEHKNVERLRSELAHLKASASAHRPASMTSRSELDRLRADHLQEIRDLKRKHQTEMDDISRSHRTEISLLKRDHQTELSQREKKALSHEKQQSEGSQHDLGALLRELADLKRELEDLTQKSASFRQQNAELREANAELERRIREAEEQTARAAQTQASDDLTELKGVGPKVAQALRAAGITRFEQIAAWTETDIDNVAPMIKTAAGRIRKSDWVAQAKRRLS